MTGHRHAHTGHRHSYDVTVSWTGNLGVGTARYDAYERANEVTAGGPGGPPPISGSSDPAFRGDPERWNPEQLLVAALSQCHLLWFLHQAAVAGVVVTAYEDRAHGVMVTDADDGGRFERVVLSPVVTIAVGGAVGEAVGNAAREQIAAAAATAHHLAHERCFIANSVNFPVELDPDINWA